MEEGTGAVIGTVDEARAFSQTHPGAIYLHQGEQYEVVELDLDRKAAVVRPSDAEWFTQARDTTDIEVLDSQYANWNRDDGFEVMQDYLARFDDIDAVWAGDDTPTQERTRLRSSGEPT